MQRCTHSAAMLLAVGFATSLFAEEAKLVATYKDDYVTTVAFSPDGKWIATGGVNKEERQWEVKLRNASTGDVVRVLPAGRTIINDIAFSPDSGFIAAAVEMKSCALVWDVVHGAPRAVLGGGEGMTRGRSIEFTPDGKKLAVGMGTREAVLFWNAPTFELTDESYPGGFHFAISGNGKRIGIGRNGPDLRVFDLETRKECDSFTSPMHGIEDLAFSPDGATLALAGSYTQPDRDFSLRLRDVVNQKMLPSLAGPTLFTSSVAYSADGRNIAVTSVDGRGVCLWEVDTGKLLATFGGEKKALAFSPSGATLATVDDNGLELWDIGWTVGKMK